MRPIKRTFRRLRARAVALLITVLFVACQGEPEQLWDPEPPDEPVLRDLRVPVRMAIEPTQVGLDVRGSFAAARGVAGGAEADLQLAVVGGSIELWAPSDEVLLIREVDVQLADIAVPPEVLPPHGAYLTGVGATLASPITVEPTDDGATATVIANLDLDASWALVVGEGESYPLSTLRLRQVPFSLEISRNLVGDLRVRLVGFRDGTFWSWAGAFELADLTVDLQAVPEQPVEAE
jgi:hypothetical protein